MNAIHKRRCQPGQRARDKRNGRIVLVIDHYKKGDEWGGVRDWISDDQPWKVISLGRAYELYHVHEGVQEFLMKLSPCCVVEDGRLVPLDDDDDGLTRSTEKDKPVKKPRAKQLAEGGVE